MSKKSDNPYLKKSAGQKPPTRREMKHGLGKGLSSLLGAGATAKASAPAPALPRAAAPAPVAAATVPEGDVIIHVPPMDIERSPWQPRTDFNEELLNELADSIRANGVIEPLVCRRRADGRLELIAGERRLRASVKAGLSKVPVRINQVDDRKAAEMTITENLQRDDLNPIDAAVGYRKLMDDFSMTQEQVSERVGKSRSAVANTLRILELPDEVCNLISTRQLSFGHAKVLLSLEEPADRLVFARDCVKEGLSVRALESRVARRLRPVVERRPARPDLTDSYVRNLTDSLRRQLGCAVRLTPGATHANGKHSKGLLEIDFVDNDDLDRLLALLGVKVD